MEVKAITAMLFRLIEDGEQIGSAISTPYLDGVFISMMYVLPEHRGRGGGAAVLNYILEFYRDTPIRLEAKAWADVHQNLMGRALALWYSRHGFVVDPGDRGLLVRFPKQKETS